MDFEVLITHVNAMPMPYKIPSFEVITLKLRKVTCIVEGKECQGLIKDDGPSTTGIGHYVCTSSCKITIDRDQYLQTFQLCDLKMREILVTVIYRRGG